MKFLASLLCLALAGCCTPEIVRVEIPVPVPCIDREKIPGKLSDRFGTMPAESAVDDQVRALLLDREAMNGYAPKLRALVESCVNP